MGAIKNVMKNPKKALETITYNIISSSTIFVLSATLSWILSVAIPWRVNVIPISIIIFFLTISILFYAWRRIDRQRPHFDRLHSDYEILEKEVTYVYVNRINHYYTKRLRIRSLIHNLSFIVDKYNWTGNGTLFIQSLIPELSVRRMGRRNIWHLYSVDFPANIRKREEQEIFIRWDLTDSQQQFRPFISQTIEVPTKKLTFRLQVPESFGVSTAKWTIRPTIDVLETVGSGTIPVRNGICDWTISNPKLLHCYELSWFDNRGDDDQVETDGKVIYAIEESISHTDSRHIV